MDFTNNNNFDNEKNNEVIRMINEDIRSKYLKMDEINLGLEILNFNYKRSNIDRNILINVVKELVN